MTARQRNEGEEAVAANGRTDGLLDAAVIGGGQAGLAMAWHLARQQLRFVVLDAAPQIGQTWRSRWDSLTLFTPAQYDALPGMPSPARPAPTLAKTRSPATSRPTLQRSACRSD